MKHYSVLKKEAIEALNLKEDGIYVDATLGYAGHSTEILKRVKKGFLFAFDQDEIAIKHSKSELTKIGTNFKVIYSNFKNIEEELRKQNIEKIDSIFLILEFPVLN